MITEIIEWCNSNDGFLSLILAGVTVVISVFTMWRSNRTANIISKKQMDLEKFIAMRDAEIQRRQMKISTFTYKLDFIKMLYQLQIDFEMLSFLCKIPDLKGKSYFEIYDKYSKIKIASDDYIGSLEQAKNIFTRDSHKFFDDIIKHFDIVTNLFSKFGVYSKILTIDEQSRLQTEKENEIDKIKEAVSCTLYDLQKLILIVNKDTNISDIDK